MSKKMIKEIKIAMKSGLNITIEGKAGNQDNMYKIVHGMGSCIMENKCKSLSINLDDGTEIVIPWQSIFTADMSINGERYG